MKDFLRLDVIVQNLAKKLKGKNKVSKLIKSISFAWFIFTIVATVWSLIPKEEKMPEVDGTEFLAAQEKLASEIENAEQEEQPEVVAEPVTV